MITIKTPATSANVGPGFDTLGLAVSLFNTFDVEESKEDRLENVEDRFNNKDNLFLKAFHAAADYLHLDTHVHAIFHTGIPVSRGLGSSASMITGGILACNALSNKKLTDQEILQLAGTLEGHPDNAAPCIFGGLTASIKEGDTFITHPLEIDPDWKFCVYIPDFEVSTQKARGILPDSYPRAVAAGNGARLLYMSEGLRTGDMKLVRLGAKDAIHEPYRKTLITGFDEVKEIVENDTGGILLISGSGSTCISISRKELSKEAEETLHAKFPGWQIHKVTVTTGALV